MQKFWINKLYITGNAASTSQFECVEINIPDICQECNSKLELHDIGDSLSASTFKYMCKHFSSYYNVWANRIAEMNIEVLVKRNVDHINDGCKCTKCGLWSAMSAPNQPDNTFKCFLCRTRGF